MEKYMSEPVNLFELTNAFGYDGDRRMTLSDREPKWFRFAKPIVQHYAEELGKEVPADWLGDYEIESSPKRYTEDFPLIQFDCYHLLVSEKVRNIVGALGSSFRFGPVRVHTGYGNVCKYFVMFVDTIIDVADYQRSNNISGESGKRAYLMPMVARKVMVPQGKAIFRTVSGPYGGVYITDSVKDLFENNKCTGCHFSPVQAV
jgi:hypothetical protein